MTVEVNEKWLIDFYKKHKSIFFKIISRIKDLPLLYIDQFKDELDWDTLTVNSRYLNEYLFLVKYKEYIKWNLISKNDFIVWNEDLNLKCIALKIIEDVIDIDINHENIG